MVVGPRPALVPTALHPAGGVCPETPYFDDSGTGANRPVETLCVG